jgi:hypothetical protein
MLTESEIEWLRRDAARVLKESRDLLDREEGKKVAIETP